MFLTNKQIWQRRLRKAAIAAATILLSALTTYTMFMLSK